MKTVTDSQAAEWSLEQLWEGMGDGTVISVLDLRERSEFEARQLKVPSPVAVMNVPYFDLLEQTGHDDLADAAAAFAANNLPKQINRSGVVAVVCAKGGTSLLAAEGLRRAGYEAVSVQGGMQTWGNYYEVHPIVEDADLAIYQVSRPARGCLSYLVASAGEAIVVDPLRHTSRYLDLVHERGLQVVHVIDTHAHADHISGGPKLASESGAPYWLNAYDAIHPVDVLPAKIPYEPFRDGQRFQVGGISVRALHVPGHTLGNMALLVDERYLLAGDTLFVESVARPDLGGRAEAWAPLHYESLSRLLALPESTVILPGHFGGQHEANADRSVAASIGELKRRNEGVQAALQGRQPFLDHVLAAMPSFPSQYTDIKRVNAGLLQADEEKASELELGRNECALSRAAALSGDYI